MTRAWLLFISVSVLSAAFLASLKGWFWPEGLSVGLASASLILGAVVSGFFSTRHWRRWSATFWMRAPAAHRALFLFVFILSAMSFVFLLGENNGWWGTASPNNLGDLPYHVHLIEFFARGAHFPPMDPTFAGERLLYPYGMDLWDALWVKMGVGVPTALIVTGILSLLVTWVALWRLGGVLLVCAFFFSGGVALTLNWEHTFGPVSALEWKNLFHAVFVTQRGFLWALPAGLYVIRKWSRFLTEEDFQISQSVLWIWAVMPFFHLHSFVILSLWMGLTWLFRRRWQWRFLPALALALFLVLRSLTFGRARSAAGWDWFWLFDSPALAFFNLGPWILLPFFLTYQWWREKKTDRLVIAWSLTLFALNVRLAPWPWDQIKILIWVYLLWTYWAARDLRLRHSMTWLFALFLFWPGFLQWMSGWPSLTGRFQVQDAVDRAQLGRLIRDLKPDETVAAEVTHTHPLLGLGQSLALGYPGHAWSHGLPVGEREAVLREILSGRPEGLAKAKEIGVKWVIRKDNGSSWKLQKID